MRDLFSCYGDHAVRLSDAACSGGHRPAGGHTGVTSLYRSRLSSLRELLIEVTWTKRLVGQGLTLAVEDISVPGTSRSNGNPVLLRKKKGSKSFVCGGTVIGLYWDISGARYDPGPEPIEGFYLVVLADTEVALLLGDSGADQLRRFSQSAPAADFRLVGRREQVLGDSLYCSKARFHDGGREHDIAIRCKTDRASDMKESELWVTIDKKKVLHVLHLFWNFRGNQTVFVDGLPVDIMWDVHDWWFGRSGDRDKAVFLFRARSALERRLWLEEEVLHSKEHGRFGFSLMIHALRIP